MTPYRIGLLGLGTVGRSYVELLSQFGDECARASGRPLEVRRVVVRNLERAREFLGTDASIDLHDDPAAVIGADDIDIVVELVGGEEPAREWIARALATGQDVVTANKAVLAAHGESLFAIAHHHQQSLLFEGAVAGAIPILQVIREGLTAGPITSLTAILNGSTNWLLGQLDAGRSWDDALAEASRRGLVEADPTLDVSGKDAAHKLALIARLLTGRSVALDAIRCEGIDALRPEDLAFGRRHGLALKLVATMRSDEDAADLGVYPQWLRDNHPLASVRDENNAILLEGPTFGELVFQGRGAGGDPTAGSVIADTARAARGAGHLGVSQGELTVRDPLDRPLRHYVRLTVPDAPGVLAKIAAAFATEEISLASVEQTERREDRTAVIHAITHRTSAKPIDRALSALTGRLGSHPTPPALVRIAIQPDTPADSLPSHASETNEIHRGQNP